MLVPRQRPKVVVVGATTTRRTLKIKKGTIDGEVQQDKAKKTRAKKKLAPEDRAQTKVSKPKRTCKVKMCSQASIALLNS